MRDLKEFPNYTLVSKENLTDMNAVGYVFIHDKTKARVVLVDCDDDNKSFVIGFKTPRRDSTGVPHILEHSVLCGSKRFPVKDAMTEVGKGSLNTFMNAFTYADRTLYPFASCNEKDFDNIMSVYLDAVFQPNVYTEPKIFMQEGWHYELEDEDAKLTVNGVVYNEMKGEYSQPDGLLRNYINQSLFPDTQYSFDAGGDPECIPDLTYEDFVGFHQKLYHPSNSRIILYGNMDFGAKLKYIDEEYLSKYDYLSFANEIELQKSFDEAVELDKDYPIAEGEPTKDSTYLAYNVVVSDYSDVETSESIEVINYALCSAPGAILKERLIEAGIGKDVYSEYSEDMAQKIFSIIADGANADDKERFVQIIEDTLKEVIANGYDKKAVEAAITNQEFSYREADFGNYPKGIIYSLMIMDEYIYTDENVFNQLKQASVFDKLRKLSGEGHFEKITEKFILNNKHKSVIVMKPCLGLQDKIDEKLAGKLADYKASLSLDEIKKIVENTKELKAYQSAENTPEALATIPTLSISDIPKESKHTYYQIDKVNGVDIVRGDLNTNGIIYLTLSFDANALPERLLNAFSVLKYILSYVDTDNYKYADLNNELNIKAGGVNFIGLLYKDKADTDKFDLGFEVKTKLFYSNIKDVFELINEILFTTKLDDKKRLKEIFEETKTRIQNSMISSGHVVAYPRALAQISKSARMNEIISGMDKYRFVEEIVGDFDNRIDGLIADLKEVCSLVFTKDNLTVSFGAQKEIFAAFDREFTDFSNKLPSGSFEKTNIDPKLIDKREGFTSSMQVQYVATAGNIVKKGFEYDAKALVIRNILSSDYLWNTIRVLGGAYGCWFAVSRNGDAFFVSYRDPQVSKTLEGYKKAADYLANFTDDENRLSRFIISTIGDIDTPLTPSMESGRIFGMYKTGLTNEDLDKDRRQILDTKISDVREFSKVIEAICDSNCVCVVGNENVIGASKDCVDVIIPMVSK